MVEAITNRKDGYEMEFCYSCEIKSRELSIITFEIDKIKVKANNEIKAPEKKQEIIQIPKIAPEQDEIV